MAVTRNTRARRAVDMLDSIGYNTHGNYTDTVYANQDKVLWALQFLGVRHVRDLLKAKAGLSTHRLSRRLRDAGIKTSFVMDWDGRYEAGTPASQFEALLDPNRLAGCADLLEGENERDFDGINDDDIARQRQLYALKKQYPGLDGIRLIGPSFARGTTSVPTWAAKGGTQHQDGWNDHPYPGGAHPESGEATDQAGRPIGGIHRRRHDAVTRAAQPYYATETGYHDAVSGDGRGHWPTSQRAQAAYLPRMFLTNFAAEVERSYSYELVDQFPEPKLTNREHNFGDFEHDWSPKPSAYAVQRLTRAMADDAPAKATERDVRVTITGDDTLEVHPFTKGDGSLVLAIWRPLPLQKPGTANPPQFEDQPRDVSVAVEGYGSTGTVRASAHPVYVTLVPTGATPTPQPEPPEVVTPAPVPVEPAPAEPEHVDGQVLVDVGATVDDGGELVRVVEPAGAASGDYGTVRWGKELEWALPAPHGARVLVDLIETAGFAPGQRVFTVNGRRVDLAQAVGVRTPVTLDLGHVDAVNGVVSVVAAGVVENAVVRGIRYVPAEAPVAPEPEPEPEPPAVDVEALQAELVAAYEEVERLEAELTAVRVALVGVVDGITV